MTAMLARAWNVCGLLLVAGAFAMTGCGGGGLATPAPAPGAPLSGAAQRNITSTANALPPLTTTSDQTFGLRCSPEFTITGGGYASCNVKWIAHINLRGGESIGGHFVASTHTFFVDNWESGFYAFDTTNPLSPTLDSVLSVDQGNLPAGVLVSAVENEETAVNDKVAFISRTPTKDVAIIDVSNPKAMSMLSTVSGAFDHTMRCVENCTFAYGSYDGSTYTGGHLIDATDPRNPKMLSDWSNLHGGIINVHDTTEIKPGMLATASNPVNFLDVSNPAVPKYMFGLPMTTEETGPTGLGPAQKGHVGHSVQWPRHGQDRWFLGQNEGAYVGLCAQYPPDGRTLYSYDTTGWERTHDFKMAGAYELVNGDADEGTKGGSEEVDSHGSPSTATLGTPEGCSAHWFDINPNFSNGGLVVMASFAFGARLLNVAANGAIQQVGWFVPSGLADTVGVYWITSRIMYLVDFEAGGIDIIEYTGPLSFNGSR